MTDAITREEKLLAGLAIEPITREEMFLAKLAGQDVQTPEPITRKEILLSKAIENGGGVNLLEYATSLQGMFTQSKLEMDDVIINFGKGVEKITQDLILYGAFQACNGIKNLKIVTEATPPDRLNLVNFANTGYGMGAFEKIEIPLISKTKVVNILYSFQNQIKLKELAMIFDVSLCTALSGAFANCNSLETVSFAKETIKVDIAFAHSPLLSDESIQSIIDGLATVETAQTLTLHADVVLKLTTEQTAQIEAKNWNIG